VLGSPVPQPGLVPVRSVGDAMAGDGIQQLPVEALRKGRELFAPQGNDRLERLQRLERRLEADRPRVDAVSAGRLGDDRADQIVGQDVRPHLLAHQFRHLAPQHVHLHRAGWRRAAEPRLGNDAKATSPLRRRAGQLSPARSGGGSSGVMVSTATTARHPGLPSRPRRPPAAPQAEG